MSGQHKSLPGLEYTHAEKEGTSEGVEMLLDRIEVKLLRVEGDTEGAVDVVLEDSVEGVKKL